MIDQTILIVDDTQLDLEILQEALGSTYKIESASSAQEALKILEQVNPTLVLTDVVMEGLDGYQLCNKIKEAHPNMPVIFVSANSNTEEVLKGLDAGGFDYLFKPIDIDILHKKVSLAIAYQQRLGDIQEQHKLASQVAYTAMNSASDLGAIINFLRELTKAQTLDDLATSIISSLSTYQLHASFLIHHEPEPIIRSNRSYAPPLDIEILRRAKEINQRIFERGTRLIVTYENISFLVKNLPSENEQRIGELRDCLAILAESAHEVYRRISAMDLVEQQRGNMLDTLDILTHHQKLYKESSVGLLDELATEVELLFCTMGLTEEQEQGILNVIKGGVEKGLNQMELGLEVDEKMRHLTASLQAVTRTTQRLAH